MPNYTFWYKKEIKAKELDDAVKLAKKAPYKLSHINQEQEQIKEEPTHNTHCIGFQYFPEYDGE